MRIEYGKYRPILRILLKIEYQKKKMYPRSLISKEKILVFLIRHNIRAITHNLKKVHRRNFDSVTDHYFNFFFCLFMLNHKLSCTFHLLLRVKLCLSLDATVIENFFLFFPTAYCLLP